MQTPHFPIYVQEYIQDKKAKCSLLTLSGYLYNIEKFLNWLLEEGIEDAKNIRDIPYESLSKLAKLDVEGYSLIKWLLRLAGELDNDIPKRRSTTNIAKHIYQYFINKNFKILPFDKQILFFICLRNGSGRSSKILYLFLLCFTFRTIF